MNRLFWGHVIIFWALGCGAVADQFEKEPEEEESKPGFEEIYADLTKDFLHNGLIVSRDNGQPEHQGEAILWTGIAAGALPCWMARPFMDKISDMSIKNGGYFERTEPLGEYVDRPINFDGMSGVYFGYAGFISHCEIYPALVDSWGKHRKYLSDNGDRLHPNTSEKYPNVFDSVVQAIDYRLGLRSSLPNADALKLVSTAASTWATGVVLSQSACYRIHLSFLQLKALDYMGVGTGRDSFCRATGKAGDPSQTAIDIPLIDHYCGRDGLKNYLDNFLSNQWEYRFQRCGAWETPDGNNIATPGLDFLVGYSEYYHVVEK